MFTNLIDDVVAVLEKDRTEFGGFRQCHVWRILILKQLGQTLVDRKLDRQNHADNGRSRAMAKIVSRQAASSVSKSRTTIN